MNDELPWNYADSNVEVALTGPAFRHIRDNRLTSPFVYNSVCSKA